MAKISPQTFFHIHLFTAMIMFGLLIFTQFVFYPLLANTSPTLFPRNYYPFLVRLYLVLASAFLVDVTSGIYLAIGAKNFDLQSQIGGDLVILIGLLLLFLVFDIPSLVFLRDGLGEQAFRTIRFSNGFRFFCWIFRMYYLIQMIGFFHAHDTIYDYSEFS